MATEQKTSTTMHVFLWLAQVILSLTLLWAAYMKLFQPANKLAAMWPWTAEHTTLVKVTGVFDLLAGIGLILPALLRVQPKLTTYAAIGVILLMAAAIFFHITRGEAAQIGVNVFFALIAAFIVWGRSKGRI